MNDLEHDLRELFDQRASDVDVPGLAPATVLKRGRRRQVGTVVTGVLACLVALGVAAAAVGQARHPAIIPGGGNGLPARTTSIGGVPVTAPAEWTLVDDYPLAAVYATTSETCTFTGTGSAVDSNGSPVENNGTPAAGPGGDGSGTQSQTCTGSTKDFAAGIPIFQLANFEVPLGQSVCGQGNYEKQATLPDDGVAVYVADDQAQADIPALLEGCSGSGGLPIGEPQSFLDAAQHTYYVALAIAGPNAPEADIERARSYLDSLGGIHIDPTVPPAGPGPGYVMAAGESDSTAWRLEAGITSYPADGGVPGLGAIMVTTTHDGTGARTVDLSSEQYIADDYIDLGGTGIVQFGTAAADVTGVGITLPSGGTVPATMLAWPTQIGSAVGVPNLDGSLWFASASERGSVHATFPSTPTGAPTAEATLPPASDKLDARIRLGNGFVVSGHDLGHDWQIQLNEGQHVDFYLDGAQQPMSSINFMVGNETQVDVPGGTFIVSMRDPTVSRLAVTTDAKDQQPSTTIVGRWLPIQDTLGDRGLLWVIPLPGSGTGTEQANNDLPTFVSWPSSPMRDGTLLSGASDGVVSWALTYRNDQCVVLQTLGADPGNSGTSGCLPPWIDLSNTPLVGGVYGSSRATAAIVLTHRPQTTVTSPDLHDGELQCDDFDFESNFAGTTICVFPVEVGQSVTIDMSQPGGRLNHPITVQAEPGQLNLIQGDANLGMSSSSGSATAASSP